MSNMAARAVAAAMEVEAKKDRLQQNQDGTWKLVLTIAPDGLPDPIMKALPGTRYCAVFVEKGDNEEPIQHAPAAPKTKPKRHWDELSYAEQAGIRCTDPRFWKFISEYDTALWEGLDGDGDVEIAAEFVRQYCAVSSRAMLGTFPGAASTWRGLNAEFEEWDNRVAEER